MSRDLAWFITLSFYLDVWSLYHVWLVNINFSLSLISLQCKVKGCKYFIIFKAVVAMWIYGEFCCTWITWAIIWHSNGNINIFGVIFYACRTLKHFQYCKPIFFRDDFISRFNLEKTGSRRLIYARTPYSTPCCYYESWFAAKNFRDDLALAIFSPPRINFGLQYLESFLECLNDLLQVVLEWIIAVWCRVLEWIIDRWCRVRDQCFVTRIRIITTVPNLVSLYYNIHVYCKAVFYVTVETLSTYITQSYM